MFFVMHFLPFCVAKGFVVFFFEADLWENGTSLLGVDLLTCVFKEGISLLSSVTGTTWVSLLDSSRI